MTGQGRQIAILASLAAVLVGVLYVQRGASNPSPSVAGAPTATTRVASQLGAPEVSGLRLDALRAVRSGRAESERNPFRFRQRVVDAPKPAAGRGRGVASLAPPPQVDLTPQGPPPPPPIALRFIGLVDPSGSDARAAIFSDTRGNVFSGREGDIIEGRYRVVRVGVDAAELVYLDGRGRQTIRLSGQ